MIFDSLLTFVPIQAPLSLVGAIGLTFPSQVIDFLGSGVGTAPQNIIGNRTLPGQDSGISAQPMLINAPIGTTFTTADGATLNMAFQGAPDTGAAGGYQPGAWVTFDETGYQPVAGLTAGQVLRLTWPVAWPASGVPRFVRLLFSPLATTQFTAGTIASALVVSGRDDYAVKYAANNYTV